MKTLLTTISAILFIIKLNAQSGSITGKVLDKETGEPMFGATVVIKGTTQGDAVDENGKYTIKPVQPGTYTLVVSNLGYKSIEINNVYVSPNEMVEVNANMNTSAYALGPFEIVDYEREKPLFKKGEPNIEMLTISDIKKHPNNKEPLKMLDGASGVKVSEDGKKVLVRGSRPTATQFIVDGVKSQDGTLGVPNNSIGMMKVYTSGIPAQYGDVIGGVIVVETKNYFDLIR
jgi:hypothetical protein